MKQIEKTVFISYRRTNAPWALAIYQNLTHQGYDVFFDFNGIASGDFEQVILTNIKARAHFLVVLTPSSLERCGDPGDWLRREIETALDNQRNIVPLMLEGFDITAPAIASHLTGKLATLSDYNALPVPASYFDEAMGRLRDKYLNIPLDAVLHPTTAPARQVAKAYQTAASAASPVQPQELTAQEWFEQGFDALDADEKIRCYTETIRFNSDYIDAYNNRGIARSDNGDLEGALQDYDEAIRLSPDYPYVYYNRAELYETKDNYAAAAADFQKYLDLGGGVRDGDQVETEKRISRNILSDFKAHSSFFNKSG